jgi:SAM-dependent methyltransferase
VSSGRLDGVKRMLGPRWTARARCVLRGYPLPLWGNMRRVRPFSERYGFERGTPIDRYYLHQFLAKRRSDIRGDVLEIQVPSYAKRFGDSPRVVHTLDIDPAFTPTYCCDLARADEVVPAASYDCFLLPQTLSVLPDVERSLQQALRLVRPGGVVLASTAAFAPLIPDGPDYWRLSAHGWKAVAARAWTGCDVEVTAYGNCLAAAAAMYGLAAEELTARELDVQDHRYPVLVTLRCQKPPSWV